MITIIIMTAFTERQGKLFSSRYLRRTLLFTFDQTITDDYAELLDLPKFRPCLPYTLVCGSRGGAIEMRMALSQLHFLAINGPEKGITLIQKWYGSC